MKLNITKNIDEQNHQVVAWFIEYVEKVLQSKNSFSMVLSGGSTPKKLYQLLSSGIYKNKIDWSRLHFFWGDERYVPFANELNNAKMAFENLLDHVPVIKEQIHIIRTDIKSDAAAVEYENLLHKLFPDGNHTFDLVLLGMGEDAHTLSLFPGSAIVNEKNSWVRSVYSEEQKMYRITLTAPVINAASRVVFLVSGSTKAAALFHVLSGEHNPDLYPSQIIQPYNNELYWWVDEPAAADIV